MISSYFIAIEAAFGLPASSCVHVDVPRWPFKLSQLWEELQIIQYLLNKTFLEKHESKIQKTILLVHYILILRQTA